MWRHIKVYWQKPSALELMSKELREAEVLLLESQTMKEYHENMAKFQEVRIARLRRQIKEKENENRYDRSMPFLPQRLRSARNMLLLRRRGSNRPA